MAQLWKIRMKLRSAAIKARLWLVDGQFMTSKFGPRMRVRRLDYTRRIALLREGAGIEYYEDVFEEVSRLREGMAFFDFGANAGLFTLVASSRVGPGGVVFAFEPSITVYQDLIDNIVENGAFNVVPFNLALGADDGFVQFDEGKKDHSGIASVSPEGARRCAQLTLDGLSDALECLCGDRSIALKMDIEGAEVLALQAMTRLLSNSRLETAIVEVDDALLSRFGASSGDLYTIFTSHGFRSRFGMGHGKHYNEVFTRIT